ncbi:hypothetical protein ACTFIR_007744 [Dictyostelium discoideum]
MLINPYIPSKKNKKKRSPNNTTTTNSLLTSTPTSSKLTVQPEENERDLQIKKTYENFYTEFPTLKEIYRNNTKNNNNNNNNCNNITTTTTKNTNTTTTTTTTTTNIINNNNNNNNNNSNNSNNNNNNSNSNNNNNNNSNNNNNNNFISNDKYFKKNLEGIKSKINKNFKEICEKEFCNCDSKFIACYCETAKLRARQSPESQREMEKLTEFKESFKDPATNWKKRDILYYCFIQRDNEVPLIWEFVENICLYYRLSYGAMLDIGCGLGRMFSEYDRSKFEIIEAFEPDEDYYNFAYDYSKNTCDRVDVYRVGFLDMNITERYDMIISIHGPLQYLNKLDDRIMAMKKLYDACKPGGIVLIDISNFMCGLSNIMNSKQQKMLINGSQVVRTSTVHTDTFNGLWCVDDIFYSIGNESSYGGGGTNTNGGGNANHTKIQLEDDSVHYSNGHLMVEELTFAIISKSELQLLFISSGFINIKSSSHWNFDSFLEDGGKTNQQGARIIMVGQKPLPQ